MARWGALATNLAAIAGVIALVGAVMRETKGKAKEATGAVTGDKAKKSEARSDQDPVEVDTPMPADVTRRSNPFLT
jgi:hypothetical protein